MHGHLARARDHAGDDVAVRRAVHTVKGAAATWGLDDIVGLCHAIEDKDAIAVADLDAVAGAIDAFVNDNDGLADLVAGSGCAVEIANGEVDRLQRLVSANDQVGLRRFVEQLRLRRADALLGPLGSYVERLGQRLDKPTQLTVDGGDTPIDGARLGALFSLLPHLVRNAVDHGVEERGGRGDKPAVAHVGISFGVDGDDLVIVVDDDGRGIDIAAVEARARDRGVFVDGDVNDLVFEDGVSTADGASDVSGRGVGLSAVKEAVEALGGAVSVASAAGRGTVVTLRVPQAAA